MRAIVVGAGMVGLATAWHLQQRGVEVTVLERTDVAAGSSWGNAGWLTPSLAIPLADPSVWKVAFSSLTDPGAPLHVAPTADLGLVGFMTRFAAHATHSAWDRAMAALTPIDRVAFDAYDELAAAGVEAPTHTGPYVVGFETPEQASPFLEELRNVARFGLDVPITPLTDPRELVPQLSGRVRVAYRLDGQRFIEPGPFVRALADSFVAGGGRIVTSNVNGVVPGVRPGEPVALQTTHGIRLEADAVVLATGAWLPKLARLFGVRTAVRAGRGYSFSVAASPEIQYPVYFPAARIACTPYQGRFRIAGTMEFRSPDDALDSRRIRAMVEASAHLFQGLNLGERTEEWVGARPVTPDGLPLVGATAAPGVYVAGGHGMWGMVLGPATGRALAELITTGRTPTEIAPFNPLR